MSTSKTIKATLVLSITPKELRVLLENREKEVILASLTAGPSQQRGRTVNCGEDQANGMTTRSRSSKTTGHTKRQHEEISGNSQATNSEANMASTWNLFAPTAGYGMIQQPPVQQASFPHSFDQSGQVLHPNQGVPPMQRPFQHYQGGQQVEGSQPLGHSHLQPPVCGPEGINPAQSHRDDPTTVDGPGNYITLVDSVIDKNYTTI